MADLDDPTPTPTPAEPVPEPAPAAEPDEPGAIVVNEAKHVPLSALLSEREKGKQLKAKADLYDEAATWLNQVKPYVDFLQANPDVMTRRAEPAAPAAPAAPAEDPAAAQLATTLDLYTPEGKPDVARAKTLIGVIDTIAEAKADARVRPITEQSEKSRSADNYQRALVTVAPDGRKVDPTILHGIWSKLPASVTADEQVASILVYSALGYDVMHKTPVATPQPLGTPLVTESAGSRVPAGQALSSFDERIASHRGVSPAKYQELTAGFIKGRPAVLEE